MNPNDIDAGKLARLRMDLVQARASQEGLTQARRDSRDAEQRMAMLFPLSRAGESHFRIGDDAVESFLSLTPEQQTRVPAEVRAAREIQTERENGRALQVRIDALRPQVDALAQLVNSCDEYVKEARA